jgi:23S rRNA (adenine2030-N6)-methyltransferase
MNYRHVFHAGNFADVFKHAVLGRILMHLRAKPAPFRVIDTHAGAGLYDLQSEEARRGGEWRGGIGRLIEARANGALAADVEALLMPLFDVLAALNPPDRLSVYPGSPALARAWLRPQDRLLACELEPKAAAALAANLRGDPRIKTLAIDGWTALSAYLPPKERRGVVLVDPPFERPDEFSKLVDRLAHAHRNWPTGIYMLWYPIKDRAGPDRLAKALRRLAIPKILRAEMMIAPPRAGGPLSGSGLILVNPPWTLESELKVLSPFLSRLLASDLQSNLRDDAPAAVGRSREDPSPRPARDRSGVRTRRPMWRLDRLTGETA